MTATPQPLTRGTIFQMIAAQVLKQGFSVVLLCIAVSGLLYQSHRKEEIIYSRMDTLEIELKAKEQEAEKYRYENEKKELQIRLMLVETIEKNTQALIKLENTIAKR